MLDDVTTAYRSLRSSPGFTLVALIVLALGIGSGTAIFSVVDAVVLRGLPFDEHDRLGVVYEKDIKRTTIFGEGNITSQTYLDWRQLQQPFLALTAAAGTAFNLKTEGGEPADARAQRVTWEFFPVLRVAPAVSTVSWHTSSRSGRTKSAFGWRSAPRAPTWSRWCSIVLDC